MASRQEVERAITVKNKVSKIINIIISVLSIIAIIIIAFLCVFHKINLTTAGILIPLFLMIYLLMGLFSLMGTNENRKSVMIIYIIAISLCGILLFFSIIYKSVH